MNRNEFYKQLMSEYSFDADKIREKTQSAARMRGRNSSPCISECRLLRLRSS